MAFFTSYAEYLRRRYGGPAYRVAVDAGLGCPNRGQQPGGAGCIWCEPRAAGPNAGSAMPVEAQVEAGVRRLAPRRPRALLLYFQAYSGTNAPPARLRSIYDAALGQAHFRALIVATRPDCLDAERADLLASYMRPGFDVWVELGLQSASDRTLRLMGRGHTVADFSTAFHILRSRGISVAVHLIYGLPGEGRADILETARFVGSLRPQGVKIHNLHVCRDTPLASLFLRGEVTVPSPATHLRYVAETLEYLPEQTLILRLTTDTASRWLLAPATFTEKAAFVKRLTELMRAEGRRQGRLANGGSIAPERGSRA